MIKLLYMQSGGPRVVAFTIERSEGCSFDNPLSTTFDQQGARHVA